MKTLEAITPILPETISLQLSQQDAAQLEAIRLRSGQTVLLQYHTGEREVFPVITTTMLEEILSRACHRSVYAYSDMISQGFLTLEGGHRIGICGTGVSEDNNIETIRDITSLNIRIARNVYGCADLLLQHIHDSALLVGPPGSGKTTLLRDLIRQLSDTRRFTIGVADERGELSAGSENRAVLGKRTDVLRYIPKEKAMLYLLRTMSPDWIAVDEITEPADITAMERLCYCGVKILATAHGSSMEDLHRRPLYRKLLASGWFQQIVFMKKDKSYTVEDLSI